MPTKTTIKNTICSGIIAGHTMARILKAVEKKHPSSRADETHVKYYSGYLKRDGTITEEQHASCIGKKVSGRPSKKVVVKKAVVKKAVVKKAVVKKAVVKKAVVKKPSAKKPPAKTSRRTRVKTGGDHKTSKK